MFIDTDNNMEVDEEFRGASTLPNRYPVGRFDRPQRVPPARHPLETTRHTGAELLVRIGAFVKNRGGAIALASTALLLLTLTPILPTMAAEAASSDSLVYSTSASRTSPQKLFGASVQGDIYVAWTGPVSGSVYFALDPIIVDGGIKSASYDHTERFRPYDLAGTRSSGAAAAFHTRDLSDGWHRLALLVGRDGTSPELQVVSFEVRNSMATAPAPGAPPRTTMVSADFDDQTVGQVSPESFNEQVGPSNGDTGAYQGMTYAADTAARGR